MQGSAAGHHLAYATMARLKVPRPVDRILWISEACAGQIVLDIGCYDETALVKRGTPHWLHGRILQRAVRVVGLDNAIGIPDEGIRTAENGIIFRRDASVLDVEGLAIEDADMLVAGEFIEHLEFPLAFLRTAKQKYAGRDIIISTPNGACFANTLMGAIGREVQHPDHLHNFTFKTLNTLCLRAGFSSWEIQPYRFYATEMILASKGLKRVAVILVQGVIRVVERLFPLLSFGYIVRARM